MITRRGGVSHAQYRASRCARRQNRIVLPEGTTVLVTPLIEEDTLFWARVSHIALDAIWDNAEDDVYAQLLKE
jgi:hypothetical protein